MAALPIRNLAQMYDTILPNAKAHHASFASLLSYALYKWPWHVHKHGDDNTVPRLARLLMAFLGSTDVGSDAF
jgi:hypothetical protein